MTDHEWFVLEGFNAYVIAVQQGDKCWMQTHFPNNVMPVGRLGDTTIERHWSHRWDDVRELDDDSIMPYLNRDVDLLEKTHD